MKYLYLKLVSVLAGLLLFSSCSNQTIEQSYELKSPCVSAGDIINDSSQSPCVHRKVNNNNLS